MVVGSALAVVTLVASWGYGLAEPSAHAEPRPVVVTGDRLP